MNNKMLIGFVVLIAGVIAGWYLLGGKGSLPVSVSQPAVTEISTTPKPSTEKTVVTYGDSGFTPNTLSIKVGTAVAFFNESASDMWVASAVHPTHQVLPGFDQMASVPKGGSYEYTFVKVGTWKYHNHMNPSYTGSVMVIE